MFKGIDLSSDTATKPSLAMKQFMLEAELGDEQKREDPTTLQLEEMAAKLFGFEYAAFVPSATMANQIAIQALTRPGDIVMGAENCHLFLSESGGPAIHAQVLCRPISTSTGIFSVEDAQHHSYWFKNGHHPRVSVISIENTTNLGGGVAWAKTDLREMINYAKSKEIKTHLDGARIFNASIKLKLLPHEIAEGFDIITVCLSKGLGCPVGALLMFNKSLAHKVLHLKRLMGGAMRQSGILAAAGIYAFEHNIDRLAIDHE